ncbi:MAG: YicC/YloC family endoribonuclease [Anderseniella sp.]|jgi:uncharacterized protein (TIGR00255 family)|nr:YicC/YloC family endoribonuclease [Anderseniella sp.]
MSISSMTGFGRAAGTAGPWSYQWELRSVNGKGLDVRVRLPSGMDALEQQVRSLVAAMLKRGNVQVSLQLACEDPAVELRINPNALFAAVEAAQQVSDAMGEPVSADAVLAMRGVVEAVSAEADPEALAARDEELLQAAGTAIEALAANRREEGKRLASVIATQLDRIEALAAEAAANPSRTPHAIQARLAQQVERLTGASPALDPDRLHQEAMMLAVKADIQEELDRLTSHVEAARELLTADGEPVGRKFEFLAQEFNREANTLCSKSSDAALTRIGLELKNIIDQLREQVQNIE